MMGPQMPGAPQPGQPPGPAAMFEAFDIDMEEIKRQADEVAKEFAQRKPSDFFNFQKGPNYCRFLGPWSKEAAVRGDWTKFRSTHYQLFGDQQSSCYELSHPQMGFRCPICHVIKCFQPYMGETLERIVGSGARHANGMIYDVDEAGNFSYRRLKPYVIRLPLTVYSQAMQLMKMPGVGSILNVNTGWIINVNRPDNFQGKNQYTTHQLMKGPLATPEVLQQILSQMHNLDTFADFGLPTIEKLQVQMKIADALLQSCCAKTGWRPEQIPGLGTLELVVPDAIREAQAQMVPGVATAPSTLPAPPMASPPMSSVAATTTVPVVAIPVPTATVPMAPTAIAGPPTGFPEAPATTPAATPPLTMPAAAPELPSAPGGMGGMPGMVSPLGPAGLPAAPTLPVAPGMAPSPPLVGAPGVLPELPTLPPMAGVMPEPGPAPMPPSPVATVPATVTTPAVDSDVVLCPVCGKECKGVRGLKMHLAKSPACAAGQPAVPTAAMVPTVPQQPVQAPVAAVQASVFPQVNADGTMPCEGNFTPTNPICGKCANRAQCIAKAGHQ